MKYLFITTLFLSLFSACKNRPSKQDGQAQKSAFIKDSLERYALDLMRSAIDRGSTFSLNKKSILFRDTSISVTINVEFEGQKNDKWLYAANIITELEAGGKKITMPFGSIGIDSTYYKAANNCIVDWLALFATPFTNLLNDKEGIVVNGLKAYPGYMGIRGTLTNTKELRGDEDLSSRIIAQLRDYIPIGPEGLTPIDIKLVIEDSKVKDGEVIIAGKPSVQMLEKLKQFNDWPDEEKSYMLKQVYLIRKI